MFGAIGLAAFLAALSLATGRLVIGTVYQLVLIPVRNRQESDR